MVNWCTSLGFSINQTKLSEEHVFCGSHFEAQTIGEIWGDFMVVIHFAKNVLSSDNLKTRNIEKDCDKVKIETENRMYCINHLPYF